MIYPYAPAVDVVMKQDAGGEWYRAEDVEQIIEDSYWKELRCGELPRDGAPVICQWSGTEVRVMCYFERDKFWHYPQDIDHRIVAPLKWKPIRLEDA